MCDTIAGRFASRPVDIRKSNMPQSGRSESRVVDSEGASMARSHSSISTRIYFIEIDTSTGLPLRYQQSEEMHHVTPQRWELWPEKEIEFHF